MKEKCKEINELTWKLVIASGQLCLAEISGLPFSSQLLEHSFPSHSCSLVPLLASPFGKCEFNILCMRLLADGTGEGVSMRTLSEVV